MPRCQRVGQFVQVLWDSIGAVVPQSKAAAPLPNDQYSLLFTSPTGIHVSSNDFGFINVKLVFGWCVGSGIENTDPMTQIFA